MQLIVVHQTLINSDNHQTGSCFDKNESYYSPYPFVQTPATKGKVE